MRWRVVPPSSLFSDRTCHDDAAVPRVSASDHREQPRGQDATHEVCGTHDKQHVARELAHELVDILHGSSLEFPLEIVPLLRAHVFADIRGTGRAHWAVHEQERQNLLSTNGQTSHGNVTPHVATHAPHNVLFTHLCKNAQPHFASSSFHQLPVRQDHTLPQPAVSLAEILIQSPVHSMVQHNLPCHTTPKQQPHISAQGVRRAHTTSKQPTNCATPCSFRRTSKFPGWGSQCTKPCTWIMSPNVREAMPASWRGSKEGGV